METLNAHLGISPETNLHHYTSIKGFLGIIESRQLWATDLQYMNDTKELIYAGDLLNEIIIENYKSHENYFELSELFKGGIYNSQYASVFGISFSEARDLLSQWRGYGGDAGMALCFQPSKLKAIAEANQMQLVKCVYDRDTQIKIVSEICDHYAEIYTEMRKENPKFDRSNLSEMFFRDLQLAGAIIKHPTFKDENEWRMISQVFDIVYEMNQPLDRMGFREGRSTIIPYLNTSLEVDFKDNDRDRRLDLGFHDVLIGPTGVAELPWRAVMNFLHTKNVRYSQITPSGVPLRGAI